MVRLEKYRLLYLASGALFLVVAVAGGAWWELIVGSVSSPVLYLGLSPFELRVELLGSQLITLSPFMNALFLSARLLAIFGSATIIVGSLLRGRALSRRLLNLRPFTMSVGFGALVLLGTATVASLAVRFNPQIAQVAPDLREALMPYSSRQLTLNLYPLTRTESIVKASSTSRFTIWHWLALLSGALCLAGTLTRKKEERRQPH
ncbi:MAG: hypothetical protein QXY49_02655 [Thermofilaceae archaeon]